VGEWEKQRRGDKDNNYKLLALKIVC